MTIRDQFQKVLERKQQEIHDLQLKLEKAKTYAQAIQDSMRLLPRNTSTTEDEQILRPGTALSKTREILKASGKPMHITEILKALNQPIDKKHRLSLSGSLSAYVRKSQIFNRPAPNTFGLIEMNVAAEEGVELPDDFGSVQ